MSNSVKITMKSSKVVSEDTTTEAPVLAGVPTTPLPLTRETARHIPDDRWGDVAREETDRVDAEFAEVVRAFYSRFAVVLRRTTQSSQVFELFGAVVPIAQRAGLDALVVKELHRMGHITSADADDATATITWRHDPLRVAGGEPDDDSHSEVSDDHLMPEKRPANLPDGLESGSVALATAFWAKFGTTGLLPLFRKRGELSRFYIDSFAAGTWGEGMSPRHFSQVLFALSRSLKVVRVESDRRTGRTGVHLHWLPSPDEVARARAILRTAEGTVRGRPAQHHPRSHDSRPRIPPRGVSGGTLPVGGGVGGGGAPRVDDEVSRVLSSRGYAGPRGAPRDSERREYVPRDIGRAAGGGGRAGGRASEEEERAIREAQQRYRAEVAEIRMSHDPSIWAGNRSSSPRDRDGYERVPRRAYYGARR
jgi:hypothetical protein